MCVCRVSVWPIGECVLHSEQWTCIYQYLCLCVAFSCADCAMINRYIISFHLDIFLDKIRMLYSWMRINISITKGVQNIFIRIKELELRGSTNRPMLWKTAAPTPTNSIAHYNDDWCAPGQAVLDGPCPNCPHWNISTIGLAGFWKCISFENAIIRIYLNHTLILYIIQYESCAPRGGGRTHGTQSTWAIETYFTSTNTMRYILLVFVRSIVSMAQIWCEVSYSDGMIFLFCIHILSLHPPSHQFHFHLWLKCGRARSNLHNPLFTSILSLEPFRSAPTIQRRLRLPMANWNDLRERNKYDVPPDNRIDNVVARFLLLLPWHNLFRADNDWWKIFCALLLLLLLLLLPLQIWSGICVTVHCYLPIMIGKMKW